MIHVLNAIKEYKIVGMTTNMWTDDKCVLYLRLTVHFVKAAKLLSTVLSLEHFQDDVKNTENVKET